MHQLRVGDVSIDAVAQGFEVVANEFGRVDLDAKLTLRGQFESPRATGDITLNGDLKVDAILAQALYHPYATEQVPITQADVVSALNPWDRLGLDLTVHVPQTLKLTGSNIQISPDTPLGVGDINLRAGGDVYLYKDRGQPLYTNGSLYRMSGTYRFQGRAFQIDEANSSINFQSDATNPELYVTVTRVISAVETRVTLSGALRQPELHFASNPPLDDTDILSLIVFNASPNDLTTAQRQELAVRAGALAAGFLAAPLMSAIEREIGLDVLELEPGGEYGTGPKVTLGDEIAPGLIARFSREFGPEPYDEATIEYYLSRILRLRATLSDAQSLNARAPFRRVERAGIDLLLFFSF
jgi:translocation and assembly module TamB